MTNTTGGGPGTPPGWYPDAQGTMRWWDGARWTEHAQGPVPTMPQPVGNVNNAPGKPWYAKKTTWAGGVVVAVLAIAAVSGGEPAEDPAAASEPTSSTKQTSDDKASEKSEKQSTEKKAEEPAPKPELEPQAVKVAAGDMLAEFEGNEAAADAKYKGKLVQVTGHVEKVDTEFWDDEQYVVQLSNGDEWALWTVNCNDVSADAAAKVPANSNVTVRGTFDDGGDLGVEIKDCEIL